MLFPCRLTCASQGRGMLSRDSRLFHVSSISQYPMDPFPLMLIRGLILTTLIGIDADVNPRIFNILDYGAVGDGNSDDTSAFIKAWNDTCNTKTGIPTMVIPGGKTFLVHPITFAGPCKYSKSINIQLWGVIIAPSDPNEWKQTDETRWIIFSGISGLNITGFGFIDGRGSNWWKLSCRYNHTQGCIKLAPTALSFIECHQVEVSNVHVINSPQTHILVLGSDGVGFRYLYINAPETSPNTDGIHIQASTSVTIHGSIIAAGDDCVSIGDHTSYINVTYVNCGPGHGVSIGSLGRDENVVQVDNIYVRHVNFYNTTNGVRIKTWQVGRGQVQHVVFEHLNFTWVENPIIIDQYYCDVPYACNETGAGVHISDVTYFRSFGTSNTQVAVNFNCSKTVPCTNILLDTVELTSAIPEEKVTSSCNNAHGFVKGVVQPKSCLLG